MVVVATCFEQLEKLRVAVEVESSAAGAHLSHFVCEDTT